MMSQAAPSGHAPSPPDTLTQMKIYKHYVAVLADPNSKEDLKVKAAMELTDNFEVILTSPHFPAFLEHSIKLFLKVLQDGPPLFISEYNLQQVRKQILEMMYLLPWNDQLRPYVRQILSLMFKMIEIENEENVLVCLRIIIELHKQFRPAFNSEIHNFIQLVKSIYRDLPSHKDKIFDPRPTIKVKDIQEMDITSMLAETYTVTPIQTESKSSDGNASTYNLIPKGVMSLKVLQELPIVVVLMYQLYKAEVQDELSEFVPSIINTISLRPSPEQMANPAFNKEVFVDFMGAQIKTLSFLAYIIRVYQSEVAQHSTPMVRGILAMLQHCPMEVVHLRKELFIAARHITATDLRTKFVPFMDHLFDEDILLGRGWTTRESLRPLAYSTLADLVHHVRSSLQYSNLEKAIHLFSKNVHDESLPTSIQTMSCKLLLNLVDCVRTRSEAENGRGRALLMRLLQVFVLKFKTISKLQLPILTAKAKAQTQTTTTTTPQPEVKTEDQKFSLSEPLVLGEKSKFGFPTSQAQNYTIADTRSLVKTLICGVKTITWAITSSKSPEEGVSSKQFQPKETLVFINLVKWAMQALDIYTLSATPGPTAAAAPHAVAARSASPQSVRTKEEKEMLEYFAGVFSGMASQTFHEIFSTTIDYLVERIFRNYALQIVGNSFLANPSTSSIFATILVEYLLERMEEMGSNLDKSNLYLKLFKLVFGSVSLFPADNEQMLRPHLHQIVNRSMELAMSAKEPYNYFLLLRALFRSIGGGCHDLLYQEFLPLLPTLLQGLNCLQSGLHKQHMKDLFVELCLTVPVRLSSLLPYLPMLMDPLVSALNGSHTLISQGLRTLELCVDNLQPDFLYEHIQPVRADLMQALWRTLRNPQDQVAHVAFRVLGKFGGGNRKMMIEPQRLEYNDNANPGTCLLIHFEEYSEAIQLPVQKIIESALTALKTSSTDPLYRRQACAVIRDFLVASIRLDCKQTLLTLFSHPNFHDGPISSHNQTGVYKASDMYMRETHQTALTALFVAAAIKDLRHYLPTMVAVARHYTMVAVCQQAGPFAQTASFGMDPLVIVDALVTIMGHEEKELCKSGRFAILVILETANRLLGSKERACQLPLMEYLSERMVSLCYERAWYAKYGGCYVINMLFEKMTSRWVFDHLYVFLKALLFVMMDLTGEVSTGAIDMAKMNLEKMLTSCAAPIAADGTNDELINAQKKSMHEVTLELVRLVASSNTLVREQAMSSLTLIAKIQGLTVTSVMEPHREVLAEMVPPKKHLLRHQNVNAQIGIMEGYTFCTTLNPRLFTIDLGIMEHKVFFHEVMALVEADDVTLVKLPCYKNMTNLVPLRQCALRALSACHYIQSMREKIFNVLYKAMEKPELQKVVLDCMRNFIAGAQIEIELVKVVMRPLLMTLGDYRTIDLNGTKRLYYLTELFPTTFNEKFCEQLLKHLRKLLEIQATGQKAISKTGENELKIATIINIFHKIPAASSDLCDILTRVVLQTEKSVSIEASSPFREPLVQFLLRYPNETICDMFLNESIREPQWSRFLQFLIKHKEGKPFRDVVQNNVAKLITLIKAVTLKTNLSFNDRYEIQFQGIQLVSQLVRHDEHWLSSQKELALALKELWCSDAFHEHHRNIDAVDFVHWKEPKLIVKVLLHYFCHHPTEVDLLFHLLRATYERYIPDFQFLRDFLETTVAQNYTVEWKRAAFFHFVEDFQNPNLSADLKAKILQLVLIPCFAIGFERGEGDKLVGTTVAPDQDHPENVVSVFINKVIDPDNPFGSTDAVRIALLQFSCLLVEQASPHIHNAANKKQGVKLRRLMAFAWPCLLGKNCVDPSTRYHGHLLLSHIIAKFAIHKRIVLQVFHSLLKAHGLEARMVVRQALEILTPAMPHRMEDGNTMLIHWTKKIIVEEGHNMSQLFHILFLVVKHFKVYYPVRHQLIQHMIQSIQKMGFASSATMEQRKLAVELAEVVIKWELQRIRDESDSQDPVAGGVKRPSVEENGHDQLRKRLAAGSAASPQPVKPEIVGRPASKPIEKHHADSVLNYLLRLACQVNDATPTANSQGDLLSRRCVALLKTAMKPDLWPQPWDLKLAWLDKILCTLELPSPNYGNICTGLELLTFLLGVLKREQVLAIVKPMQKGLTVCISCNNSKVVRLTHGFLAKLMSMFPTDTYILGAASKYEELECLYGSINKLILEGLSNYEKSQAAVPNSLFGTIMILKAACTSNPSYIDRVIAPFMRVLQRMHKEHNQGTDQNAVATELLMVALELVKGRLGAMQADMRKTFIGTILVKLIECTREVKLLKAITKMVDEWIRQPPNPSIRESAHYPVLKEKGLLLVKLMNYVERNFPDDLELNAQFLEIINYVYRDPILKTSDLSQKLEPAFLQGLRCVQPQIRVKFFEIFDGSIKRRIYERLYYLISSQNWEAIGSHYWIKQCIELLFITADPNKQIQLSTAEALLPSMSSIIESSDENDRRIYEEYASIKREPSEMGESPETHESDELDMEFGSGGAELKKDGTPQRSKQEELIQLVSLQAKFWNTLRDVKTINFLRAAAQLCHLDTALAERVWLHLFPRVWSLLNDKQRNVLSMDIQPFLCSGAHEIQKNCQPSALNTFVEALSRCNPSVPLRPMLMKYLGKSHNLWHRMTLNLEQLAYEQPGTELVRSRAAEHYDFEPVTTTPHEVMDSLSEMYAKLCEQDMWAGLWQKHARYRETNIAIAYEQKGFFEQAQAAYEAVMSKSRHEFSSTPAPVTLRGEYKLWEEHWIRCSKELNQWDILLEYGQSRGAACPMLVLESSWKVPSWNVMKDALTQVEQTAPKEIMWKIELYRGFLNICNPEDSTHNNVEKCVERASASAMKEWRRLPHIVSHIHLPLLQAAQQIMELQEAAQIHQGLTPNRPSGSSLHDMKAIVKTWRNRLPVIADDLCHWSDIFTWRQHHYQFIASHYDNHLEPNTNHSMLGVHASAQAIIHFGKIARKHNLTSVCLCSLSRIYTIPSVPIVDCFQKIRQQVKCSLQMSSISGKNELEEGLEVIESTNLKYFTKEMTAEFYALKGMLLAQIGRSEEANKAFSAAVQMHDTLVKAWALWGDYLEEVFTADPTNISIGVQAITCFLHACRHQNESKSRKYLAKVLWLLTYDNDQFPLAQALDKYCVGVPPIQWLPWVPQLLTCLVRDEGKLVLNLISQVARIFPQAVYFPLRTLYLTLKIEQRERYKTAGACAASNQEGDQKDAKPGGNNPIRATPSMWRCSRIMQMQREVHPTVISSLEEIVDQMVCFRENPYEEVLRQSKQGLAKCYAIAFEKRVSVADATITPHTLNFVNKLVATFGTGVENVKSSVNFASSSSASVSLARRTQSTIQDPVFQMMKQQFSNDFDFSVPGAKKLQNIIEKFKKWIAKLQTKAKTLPKSILIEGECRFLSNFNQHTAEVELPGEFLLPKHAHYYVKISRFMPLVDIVHKHNTAARRLHIRGHNGKIYPYLVVNDSYIGDARREERVLQLLRMLNHYLGKQKETSSRFLHITVPRVVALSPLLRLVEDNPASISLHDVYREGCQKRGMDHDAPIARYYERLQEVEASSIQPSHHVLKEIFKEIQRKMVPKNMLKEWALKTFPSTTDYWTFRKMLMLQVSLACFIEHTFHLTRLNPDMMYLHKDSGLINVSYFKFDIQDESGDMDRPVRFRLTPNLTELISSVGVRGPVTASAIAAARCLVQPSFKVKTILRAILRDEMIHKQKIHSDRADNTAAPASDLEGKLIIDSVSNAVNGILQRLTSLSQFEGPESKMATLVAISMNEDNLCRMDPAWHPWL